MALIKINGVHGTQSFATAEDIQTVTNLDNLHDVQIDGTLGNGQYLVYNSTVNQWKNVNTPPIVSALDDLTDVDTTGKLDNYVLTWDNAASLWEAAPGGHYTDADVDAHLNTSSALTNEVLSWDGTDYSWIANTATGYVTLNGTETLTNKTLTTPVINEIKYLANVGSGNNFKGLKIINEYDSSLTPDYTSFNGSFNLQNYTSSGAGAINVLQIQTPNRKNIFRLDAYNQNPVDGNGNITNRTFTAGAFVVGKTFKIDSVGTTDFTAIGSPNNNVNQVFIATGAGTGTGTADLWDTGAQNVLFGLKGGDDIGFYNASDGLIVGVKYKIFSVGTTVWTDFGSANNTVGTEFVCDAPSSTGTGVAVDMRPDKGIWNQFGANTGAQSAPGWQTNLEFKGNKIRFHDAYVFPTSDGSANQVLTTDGNDQLSWETNAATLLQDPNPILGGDLDTNIYTITNASIDLKLKPADAKQVLIQEPTNPQTGGLLKIESDSHNFDNPQLELKNTYATSGSRYTKSHLRYSNNNDALIDITSREGNGTLWGSFETFDPLGVHLRYDTDPVPNQLSNPGDYAVNNNFDYTNYRIDTTIYGAQNGYTLKVKGDNNGGVDAYIEKPYKIQAESVSIEPFGVQKLFINENSTTVHNRLQMKNPAVGGGSSNVAEFWNVSTDSDAATKTRYGHEDDSTGTTTVHGEIRSINSSDRKNMVIGINNDNGGGFDPVVSFSKGNTDSKLKTNMYGELRLDVDGADYNQGIFLQNDMLNRSVTYMNGLNTNLNWGTGTIPDNAEAFQQFTASDDTQGEQAVGYIGAQYRSANNGLLSTMSLTAQEHDFGNESVIGINAKNAFVTRPLMFQAYTTTEVNALTVDAGTQVYNSTLAKMQFYTGSAWETITSS